MFTIPRRVAAAALLFLGVTAARAQPPSAPLTDLSRLPPEAAERYRAVLPRADEVRWQQVPWLTDLEEGLRLAHAEKRPVLLWVTDDDPLDRCWGYAYGLRAGPLSDAAVIREVSTYFVPVAFNQKAADPKTEAGRLFRAVQRQRPRQYQGLYVVAADGKVLAGHQDAKSEKTWPAEVLALLTEVRQAAGLKPRTVRPADLLPHRGVGVRPDGGATLALYIRQLSPGTDPRGFGPSIRDSVVLSAGEWAALAPPKVEAGLTWAVPEAVGRRFCRLLAPTSDQGALATPEDVKHVRITGRMLAVFGGVGYLRYEGEISAVHPFNFEPYVGQVTRGQAKFVAMCSCDAATGKMRTITLVADCVFRHVGPNPQPVSYTAVVEWRQAK